VAFWLSTLARRSAAAAIGSPDPSTYPKKRGLGGREASTTLSRMSNAAGPIPCSGIACANNFTDSSPLMSGKHGRSLMLAMKSSASFEIRKYASRYSSLERISGFMVVEPGVQTAGQ
jgi:hypothetical protein